MTGCLQDAPAVVRKTKVKLSLEQSFKGAKWMSSPLKWPMTHNPLQHQEKDRAPLSTIYLTRNRKPRWELPFDLCRFGLAVYTFPFLAEIWHGG